MSFRDTIYTEVGDFAAGNCCLQAEKRDAGNEVERLKSKHRPCILEREDGWRRKVNVEN